MKKLGYVIYQFWDIKVKHVDETEWETITASPNPEFKKRIYEIESSAKEAVEQMKKIDNKNTSYHILPIFTPEEEYSKVVDAYKERKKQNND